MMKSPTPEIVIATLLANLVNKASFHLSGENLLVLEALKRANHDLADRSISEIGDYLEGMDTDSLKGLANNVKGIYHELQFIANENTDGDEVYARLFPDTNHPGADVILAKGGDDFSEIQLKATDNISYIQEHYLRYPDVPILVTSEAQSLDPVFVSSGISNNELHAGIDSTFEELKEQTSFAQIEDSAAISGIVSAAYNVNEILEGKSTPQKASIETLKDVGAAVSATALLDILFS